MNADTLLTARDVAEKIGLSPRWVLDEFEAGRLPGIKLGDKKRSPVRFRPAAIELWLDEHERRGAAA